MANRKQLLLTVALLVLVVVGQANAGRRSSKKNRPKHVNIEIYQPKGVLIWYPYRAGIEMFGIEIFVNQANQDRSSSSSSEETPATCNICLNTTEVSYGKFILRSDDAIIRHRDHVFYNAIVKNSNGRAYVTRSNEFYVSDSRVLKAEFPGAGAVKSLDAGSAATKPQSVPQANTAQTALQDEVALLEDILDELNQQCLSTTNQTRRLLLHAETTTHLDSKQLHLFVERRLVDVLPMIDWNRVLVDTYYVTDGIVFEVTTIVDKQKILKLASKMPDRLIEDMDAFQTDDHLNDIESWVVL